MASRIRTANRALDIPIGEPAAKAPAGPGFLSEADRRSEQVKDISDRLYKDLKVRFEGENEYKLKAIGGAQIAMLAGKIANFQGNIDAKIVEVGAAVHVLSKFIMEWELRNLIQNPITSGFLVEKPQAFAGISNAMEFGSQEFFRLCNNQRMADWIFSDPKKAVSEIQGLQAKYGEYIVNALSNEAVSNLFLDRPKDALLAFDQVKSKFSERGYLVYDAIQASEIAGGRFVADPKKTTDAFAQFNSVLEGRKVENWTISMAFTAIGKSNAMASAFFSDPGFGQKTADLLVEFGLEHDSMANALGNEAVAAWFLRDPEGFKATLRSLFESVDNSTSKAFLAESLDGAVAGRWFASDPKAAIGMLRAFEDFNADKANRGKLPIEDCLGILKNDQIADFAASNPMKFIERMALFAKGLRSEFTVSAAVELIGEKYVSDLFVAAPGKISEVILRIASNGDGVRRASLLRAMGEHEGLFFSQNIDEVGRISGILQDNSFLLLTEMAEAQQPDAKKTLAALDNIDKAFGMGLTRELFANESVAKEFLANPDAVVAAISKAKNAFGDDANQMFRLMASQRADGFVSLCRNELTMGELAFDLNVLNAVELGRDLDDMHTLSTDARAKYIKDTFSDKEILALLVSDPQLMYTSTNHLLLDRLLEILDGKPARQFLQENNVGGGAYERNLVFRAMNYGRFYGGQNSLFKTKGELESTLPVLFAPLEKEGFDKTYLHMLANNLKGALDAGLGAEITSRLERYKSSAGEGVEGQYRQKASDFLLGYLKEYAEFVEKKRKAMSSRYASVFNGDNFEDNGKVINVVQTFDADDTKNDHWGYTKEWAKELAVKCGGGAKDGQGNIISMDEALKAKKEVVFEFTKGKQKFRVTLFMGENESENRDFTRKALGKYKNAILTFRGHSFSLAGNMPSNIFDNKEGNVLFIPGSCGSASSLPEYLSSNPNTNISSVSNTSTGRGQVTNALLSIFIDEAAAGRTDDYAKILDKNAGRIKNAGGDRSTLTAVALGELMLRYAYGNMKPIEPASEFY